MSDRLLAARIRPTTGHAVVKNRRVPADLHTADCASHLTPDLCETGASESFASVFDQPLSALPWFRLASLHVAFGVCVAVTVMCLAMLRQPLHRRRWAMLAAMGLLEAGYCAALIPFILAPTPDESLRWIRSTSVFMPFMTWLVVALTVEVADLQQHWMARFARFTFLFSAAFSALVAIDMFTGGDIIFTGVRHDPGTVHLKVVQATPFGKIYLVFVSGAFYTSLFFLVRRWRTRDRALAPVLVGCGLYFLAMTNDFNLVLGLYDFAFLQHYGFLAMYVGFAAYMAQLARGAARPRGAALAPRQRHARRAPALHGHPGGLRRPRVRQRPAGRAQRPGDPGSSRGALA